MVILLENKELLKAMSAPEHSK